MAWGESEEYGRCTEEIRGAMKLAVGLQATREDDRQSAESEVARNVVSGDGIRRC